MDLIRKNHEEDISTSTVMSLMNELRIRARRMSAFKTTTVRERQSRTVRIENHRVDNLGMRDFRSSRLAAKLLGDIACLRAGEGWLYLATVIDLNSRQIVGWSMGKNM